MSRHRRDVIDASEYRYFQTEAELMQSITKTARDLGYLVQHDELARGPYKGYPDLTICGHGVLIFVECKGPRGSKTPEQDVWIAELQRADQYAIVASTENPGDYDRIVTILQNAYQADIDTGG